MKPPIPILLFAKAPVPGGVKTRLIPALGAKQAARLSETLAEETVRAALASSVGPVSLWGLPDVSHPFFRRMEQRYDLTLAVQDGEDVGSRMAHALGTQLRDHPGAILAGTDLMHPTPDLFLGAAQALRSGAQAVLAPSVDGGYVLIGLRQVSPLLFRDMAWGTDAVCAETIRRLETLGIPCALLPHQRDLDTPEDYAVWSAANEEGRAHVRDSGNAPV